jgi:large subunit ribosomal protein L21
MYAVIKTGGKQYRVQPGDVLVVEKLDGDAGAEVVFDQVMMLGDKVGAPLISGATVSATLIETRKGEKVKIFKKTRRQGYRRTRGHRQTESVLQVTGIDGGKGGETAKWDGTVDLTTKAERDARARNLARGMEIAAAKAEERAAKITARAEKKAAPKAAAAPKPAKKAAAPKAEAPKAETKDEVKTEAKAAPKKAAAPKAEASTEKKAAAPKKAAAKKDNEA